MGKSKKKINKMKSLPEDVIISILVKLQVKPLMRFMCVCKSWYRLIKSSNFIEMHQCSTQNNKNECILIKRVRSNDDYVADLSVHSYESLNEFLPRWEVPHFKNRRFDVSWPCNGLLFCIGYHDKDDKSILVLCNPGTREFKLLPPCPFLSSDFYISIGLGFDSITKDYKILIIKNKGNPQIYNLSSDSWRNIDYDMPTIQYCSYNCVQAVPFNGALHWVAKRDEKYNILCFDVSTEVFQDINLPQVLAHSDNQSDIWVMKEGSWMKQISYGGGLVNNDKIIPRLLWKNDTIIINTNLSQTLKLWLLNTHELIDTEISSDVFEHQVMIYKESLVSIK